MNNFEYIKSMTIDELAEYSSVFQRCSFCGIARKYKSMTEVNFKECQNTGCKNGIKQWLLQERGQKND